MGQGVNGRATPTARRLGGREAAADGSDGAASKAELAYQSLRDRLITLEIPPGAPIHDERLGMDVGVGKTPIREALKRLEYERLVVTHPRRGTFATDVNITDLTHISEVRQQLEPLGAAIAAKRATVEDRQRLAELADQLEAATRTKPPARDLMLLDVRAHRMIYATAHNPYLESTLTSYDNLATRIWCVFLDRLPGMAGHVEEHVPLVRAICAGDQQQAAALAATHVERFEREIRNLLVTG